MQDEMEADAAPRHFRGIEVPRPIRAQYCIIVAQAFGDDRVIAEECETTA
jgi:hypothetical protein